MPTANRGTSQPHFAHDHRGSPAGMLVPASGVSVPFQPQAPAEGGGFDLGLIFRTLRRRFYVPLLLAIIGVAGGVWLQSAIQPRYTSFVEILLDPRRADAFGAETQFGTVLVDSSKIASVVSIIESSELLRRVVRDLHLADDPEFGAPPSSLRAKLLGFLPGAVPYIPPNDPQTREERALVRLEKAVRAERVGVTYVLDVSASSSNPEMAQKIAQAVADTYLDDQITLKRTAVQRDILWLAERVDGARKQLMQSEEAVEAVRRKFGLVDTDRGVGVTTDRQAVSDLNAQLTQAQTDLAARRARYQEAERLRASGGSLEGLPEAANSRVIENLRKAETDVASRLSDLSRIYADNFPEVRRLRDQDAVLQKQITAEIGRIVDGLRAEYDTAAARERGLREQLAQSTADENSTAKSDGRIQLRDAQRVVEADRTLHGSLLTRLRDVQQQQTREEPEARVISRADMPDRPSWPKPFLLPLGGGAGFLLLGLGFTLAPTLLEGRFVSVADVERRLGLLVFGGIPLLRRRDLVSPRRRASVADYAARKPLSHFAESLRTLRAYLRISADGQPSILQVTSSVPGEGKSTTAAALAISAATAGVPTVLVDVDLRSSSLSAMFDLRGKEGLADILELNKPYRSVIRELDDMPLAVIGAGSAFLPRPDMVNSKRFEALMRDLTQHYGLVILDTPPVLPVSDALVIAKHVDATILVVEWRATMKKLAEQAVKVLRTINAPLVGVMLNKVDISKVSRYEYGYAYHYGPDGSRGDRGKSRRS